MNRTFLHFGFLTLVMLLACFGANQKTSAVDAIELPEGGGEPGKACLELHWKVLKAIADEINEDQAPEELKDRPDVERLARELMGDRTYTFYTIQGGRRRGNQAILRVSATDGNQADRGEITMIYDGKIWLYGGSKWTIKVRDVGGRPTMENMRKIAAAILDYEIDHDGYPSASTISDLSDLIQPTYIEEMVLKDAWNNDLVYRKDPKKNQSWLISYGSDGKPEDGLYDKHGIPIPARLTPELTDHIGADIVMSDYIFVRHPKRPLAGDEPKVGIEKGIVPIEKGIVPLDAYQTKVRKMVPEAEEFVRASMQPSEKIKSFLTEPSFIKVRILNPQGKGPYAHRMVLEDPTIPEQEIKAFMRAVEGESYMGTPYESKPDQIRIVLVAEPLRAADNSVAGVLIIVVNLAP